MPLRLVFSAPPASAGSSTSTASLRRASASISARDVRLPVSSSDVHSIATVPAAGGEVSNTARAASSPIDTPAFMSSTPGP